ncbi:hypothetical protein [Neobacillus vireti]|uniref:hypothetical protein n=1 Tax=Neobacillus vireti TaxID=220686 RepID=UPI002FFFA360
MNKSEWSDKQLEELLRQMPKIQDHRNPRDIYQNLFIKKRKRPAWLVPSFATAAVLLLIFLLGPQLFNGTDYSFDTVKQEESSLDQQKGLSENDSANLMTKEEATDKLNAESKLSVTENDKSALYDFEVGNGTVITYWIPDAQAQFLVPVSILINSEADKKDWLTNFTETMGQLEEEKWGLTDYYPLNASFTWDPSTNSVTVDVPQDHKYGQGSAAEKNFLSSLNNNIASNSQASKINFTTNGQPGIELGNYGSIEEIDIESEGKHAYFFYTPDGMETTFLVPSTELYQDINEAFDAMKTGQSDLRLNTSIVPSFSSMELTVENDQLTITLDKNTTMKNDLETIHSFDAILLTAKEFGIETITILNAPIQQLGPFDLSQEIKVPVAANYRQIQ